MPLSGNACNKSVCVCLRVCMCTMLVCVWSTTLTSWDHEQSELNKSVHIMCIMNLEQFRGSTCMISFVDSFIEMKTPFNFTHHVCLKCACLLFCFYLSNSKISTLATHRGTNASHNLPYYCDSTVCSYIATVTSAFPPVLWQVDLCCSHWTSTCHHRFKLS